MKMYRSLRIRYARWNWYAKNWASQKWHVALSFDIYCAKKLERIWKDHSKSLEKGLEKVLVQRTFAVLALHHELDFISQSPWPWEHINVSNLACTSILVRAYTETPEMACTWLGEFSSCSSLIALPGPAWVLLSKIYKPFPGSLYILHTNDLLSHTREDKCTKQLWQKTGR